MLPDDFEIDVGILDIISSFSLSTLDTFNNDSKKRKADNERMDIPIKKIKHSRNKNNRKKMNSNLETTTKRLRKIISISPPSIKNSIKDIVFYLFNHYGQVQQYHIDPPIQVIDIKTDKILYYIETKLLSLTSKPLFYLLLLRDAHQLGTDIECLKNHPKKMIYDKNPINIETCKKIIFDLAKINNFTLLSKKNCTSNFDKLIEFVDLTKNLVKSYKNYKDQFKKNYQNDKTPLLFTTITSQKHLETNPNSMYQFLFRKIN